MFLLSGDQYGLRANPREVNWTALAPWLSHTHTSELPDRFEVNAMCRPSGESIGAPSFREDITNRTGGRRNPCGLRSSRQKLFLMVERTKAARCPWRAIAG